VFNRTGVDWTGRTGTLWSVPFVPREPFGGHSGKGPGDDGSDGSGGSGGGDGWDGGDWGGNRRHYSKTVRAVALVLVISLAVASVGTWVAVVLQHGRSAADAGGPWRVTVLAVGPSPRAQTELVRFTVAPTVAAGRLGALSCIVEVVRNGEVQGTRTTALQPGSGRRGRSVTVSVPMRAGAFDGSAGNARIGCLQPAV
jgi:hypothetical protein